MLKDRKAGNSLPSPIVVMQGGLGNQLFLWSFAHSISGPQPFQVDLLKGLGSTEKRDFELLSVLNNCTHVRRDSSGSLWVPRTILLFHLLDRLWRYRFLRPYIEKLGYIREDPRFDQIQSNHFPKMIRYARGYFQKQKNVEQIIDKVRSEIIPVVEEILPTVLRKFALETNYSVVHIRRGDYEAAEFSPVIIGTLSDEYFTKGISKFERTKLVFLTEDRGDILDLITALDPDLVLDKRDTSPWETLAIIYGSKNFLGSNSSLSWWGARICAIRGGNVWLPSQWSFWENIDPTDYHFPTCKITDVYWKQGVNKL